MGIFKRGKKKDWSTSVHSWGWEFEWNIVHEPKDLWALAVRKSTGSGCCLGVPRAPLSHCEHPYVCEETVAGINNQKCCLILWLLYLVSYLWLLHLVSYLWLLYLVSWGQGLSWVSVNAHDRDLKWKFQLEDCCCSWRVLRVHDDKGRESKEVEKSPFRFQEECCQRFLPNPAAVQSPRNTQSSALIIILYA